MSMPTPAPMGPAPGSISPARLQRLLARLPAPITPIPAPPVAVELMTKLAAALMAPDWLEQQDAIRLEKAQNGAKLGGMFLDQQQRQRVRRQLERERRGG